MNIKKKVTNFLWLALCLAQSLSAQQGVVSSGGDHFSQNGSVAYSVGQIAFASINDETGNLNPGLQQPFLAGFVGTSDFHSDYLFKLYPNPANQFLCIHLLTDEYLTGGQDLIARVYDVKGNLLITKRLETAINTIPIRDLSDAMYFVQIGQSNTTLHSISFFKTN